MIISSAIVETATLEGTTVRMHETGSAGVTACRTIELDERDWLNVTDNSGGIVSYPPGRIVCVFWTAPA